MSNRLLITQVRSVIRKPRRQKLTMQALGLRRMHQTVEHDDTPQIRGMIDRVSHLVNVQAAEKRAEARPKKTVAAAVEPEPTPAVEAADTAPKQTPETKPAPKATKTTTKKPAAKKAQKTATKKKATKKKAAAKKTTAKKATAKKTTRTRSRKTAAKKKGGKKS